MESFMLWCGVINITWCHLLNGFDISTRVDGIKKKKY